MRLRMGAHFHFHWHTLYMHVGWSDVVRWCFKQLSSIGSDEHFWRCLWVVSFLDTSVSFFSFKFLGFMLLMSPPPQKVAQLDSSSSDYQLRSSLPRTNLLNCFICQDKRQSESLHCCTWERTSATFLNAAWVRKDSFGNQRHQYATHHQEPSNCWRKNK